MTSSLPVAIIGGGPAGLAAAAHLVQYKQAFVLFESGPALGTHFLEYGHVQLFSAWRYNIDAASKKTVRAARTGPARSGASALWQGNCRTVSSAAWRTSRAKTVHPLKQPGRSPATPRTGQDENSGPRREAVRTRYRNGTGTRKLYAHEQSSMRPAPGKTPTLLYPAVRLMQQPNSSITAFQRFLAQTKNALKTSGWQWSEAAIRR